MSIAHCVSLGQQKWFLNNGSSGLTVEGRCGGPRSFALHCPREEFSFRAAGLKWHASSSPAPSRASGASRRASSFGPRTVPLADPAVDGSTALLSVDEEQQIQLLHRSADSIVNDLRGSCIFLVGMMGSGKSTVGRYVADALGYCFFDSDKLVEEAAGCSVADMFRDGQEQEFRNAETETLMQLSSMGRLVVATGGGAVVRPQNWGYLRHGITVFLDVPLEELAQRVVAVGCESRPLLGQIAPEKAYNQALSCLASLFEERAGYYRSADAVVNVAGLAAMMSISVRSLTPAMLAAQVVREVHSLILRKKSLPPR